MCQKPVSAHRMHHRVRRGHEIPLISNLREHVFYEENPLFRLHARTCLSFSHPNYVILFTYK